MSKLIFVLIFFVLFILLETGLYSFASMINIIFLKLSTKTILLGTSVFTILYMILQISIAMRGNSGLMGLYRFLMYYLGVLLYAFLVSFVFWIFYFGFNLFGQDTLIANKIIGLLLVSIIIGINVLAIFNFHKGIHVNNITIETEKVQKKHIFVDIGDTQLGSTSPKYLQKVFDLAMQQNPDFIVFVGDLIDSNNYQQNDFDVFANINVPIFFISGNHEYIHVHDRIYGFLKKYTSIKPLVNQTVVFDEIGITGIDYTKSGNILKNRILGSKIDKTKFNILLNHEPSGIDRVVQKGFDLSLHGHTHGGQLFPFTELVKKIYPYSRGFHQIGDTMVHTTQGAGLFGPRMRLGSQNEITVFTIQPKG